MIGRKPSQTTLLKRNGRSFIGVDGQEDGHISVEERLDAIGPGLYQVLVFLIAGVALFADTLEMGAIAPLNTALAREFSLSDADRSALPSCAFAGAAIGMIISGPLADAFGRKQAVLCALTIIGASMLATGILPAAAPSSVLFGLRFVSGLGAGVHAPASTILCVESSPVEVRSRMVFGINLMAALGYLLEALTVQVFMPQYGESETDRWRSFCMALATFTLAVIPFMSFLSETPSFLAVQGNSARCAEALDRIAWYNSKPGLSGGEEVEVVYESTESKPAGISIARLGGTIITTARRHPGVLLVLIAIDSCRGFYITGSSYLVKDLFSIATNDNQSPAVFGSISAVTPVIGILAAMQMLSIGLRRMAFLCGAVATLAMAPFLREDLRQLPGLSLACVLIYKLTYGPFNATVAQIKAESFPTEVRVSLYSGVSFVAKVLASISPALIEGWKENESADSWPSAKLSWIVALLMLAAMSSGTLALLSVENFRGEYEPLRDYAATEAASSYGTPDQDKP